jgi:hypothetical protein
MKRYGELRREHPQREFCFVHTSKPKLEFEERLWLGIRRIRGRPATDLVRACSPAATPGTTAACASTLARALRTQRR